MCIRGTLTCIRVTPISAAAAAATRYLHRRLFRCSLLIVVCPRRCPAATAAYNRLRIKNDHVESICGADKTVFDVWTPNIQFECLNIR